MLKNILLEIEYDGTNYFGWQIQNKNQKQKTKNQKFITVQGELEEALKKLFREEILVGIPLKILPAKMKRQNSWRP